MPDKLKYAVVEHDGGWTYKVGTTFSETYATREAAHAAAERAAREQRQPGRDAGITWEDERGRWHAEVASGDDRPDAEVDD